MSVIFVSRVMVVKQSPSERRPNSWEIRLIRQALVEDETGGGTFAVDK